MNSSRRQFIQGSAALAAAAATEGFALPAAPTTRKKPNLVYFLGEGQRADALSLAGHEILKTPNQDRIGKQGAHFRNAFCTNALCAPARTAAMTGMYSRSSGALSNEHLDQPLPADIPLFTELLRDAGYEVAIVGKIHAPMGYEDRHWDYYFGHNSASNFYNNPVFKEGHDGVIGKSQKFKNVYPDDLATDRALSWLQEDRGDKPFCLLLWFVAPHEPFFRPRRLMDLYNGIDIPKPVTFDDDLKGYPGKPQCFVDAQNKIGTTDTHIACSSLESIAKNYYAGLTAVDENMGRILGYLEKKNIIDNTAIVSTSDHGYFLGEWRMFDKRSMHEPSIRVPLVVRYPPRIPAGTVRDEMVLDIDLAPTFLDLAGISKPTHMQGKSLLPAIAKANESVRTEWYYEYFEWPNDEAVQPHRGIRTERYKLIHYTRVAGAFEMYDLQADPLETQNLYGSPAHAALQAHLLERLDALQQNVPQYQYKVPA